MNKKVPLSLLMLLFSMTIIFAQKTQNTKKKDTLTIGVDLMSRYIFRGTELGGASPSMQPNLAYTRGKFTIGLWGAYAINQTAASQEADIYATYTISKKISITLTDYFFPTDDGNYKYFDYNKLTTGHLLEASISYSGTKKTPLSILVATNFYGSDPIRLNADGTRKGIQYSSYAEFSYAFKKFDAFVGFNLTKPNKNLGESGFYVNTLGVVNLGIKAGRKVKITKTFYLPLTFSLITNPQAQKIYFVFGISI